MSSRPDQYNSYSAPGQHAPASKLTAADRKKLRQQQELAAQSGPSAYPGVSTQGLAEVGFGEEAATIQEETRQQDQYLDQIGKGLDQLKLGAQVRTGHPAVGLWRGWNWGWPPLSTQLPVGIQHRHVSVCNTQQLPASRGGGTLTYMQQKQQAVLPIVCIAQQQLQLHSTAAAEAATTTLLCSKCSEVIAVPAVGLQRSGSAPWMLVHHRVCL